MLVDTLVSTHCGRSGTRISGVSAISMPTVVSVVSRDISKIALNHDLKGMAAIYDVRDEIPDRRQALELWGVFLATCEQGEK